MIPRQTQNRLEEPLPDSNINTAPQEQLEEIERIQKELKELRLKLAKMLGVPWSGS